MRKQRNTDVFISVDITVIRNSELGLGGYLPGILRTASQLGIIQARQRQNKKAFCFLAFAYFCYSQSKTKNKEGVACHWRVWFISGQQSLVFCFSLCFFVKDIFKLRRGFRRLIKRIFRSGWASSSTVVVPIRLKKYK